MDIPWHDFTHEITVTKFQKGANLIMFQVFSLQL